MGIKPLLYIIDCDIGNVLGLDAYGRPRVGMLAVVHGIAQSVHHASVGAVEALLFEFFDYDAFLNFERPLRER